MVIGHTLQALVHHNHRNIKHKAEAFSEFLDARQVSIVKTFSFRNMYIYNNICVGRTLYVCVFVCLCIQIKKSSQPI